MVPDANGVLQKQRVFSVKDVSTGKWYSMSWEDMERELRAAGTKGSDIASFQQVLCAPGNKVTELNSNEIFAYKSVMNKAIDIVQKRAEQQQTAAADRLAARTIVRNARTENPEPSGAPPRTPAPQQPPDNHRRMK